MLLGTLILLLVSCAPVKKQGAASRGTAEKPYDFKAEGTIPAVEPEADAAPDIEEMVIQDDEIESVEAEAPEKPADPNLGREMGAGFRIQVFASAAEDIAENARLSAEARLGVTAYSVLIDGLFKVQVGDCRTRELAEALLTKARSTYYTDAWIVESQVFYSE